MNHTVAAPAARTALELLHHDGLAVALDATGRKLRLWPSERITDRHRRLVAEHRDELVELLTAGEAYTVPRPMSDEPQELTGQGLVLLYGLIGRLKALAEQGHRLKPTRASAFDQAFAEAEALLGKLRTSDEASTKAAPQSRPHEPALFSGPKG